MSLVSLDVAALEAAADARELYDSVVEEAEELSGNLGLFIRRAWHVVEPHEAFLPNWHIDAMDAYLSAVTAGEIRKLQVWVPPGSMKSRAVSVLWPAWEWCSKPWLRYFSASYDISLSTLLTVIWRNLVSGPWYQSRWPLSFEKLDERYIRNTIGGSRLATAPGSAGSGHHGHRLLIDDPLNAKETESLTGTKLEEVIQWYDGTLPTRFANPKTGVEVIIMQRLHENDLAAHALKLRPETWEVLCLPERYEPAHPYAWTGDRVHPFVRDKLKGTPIEDGDPRGVELVEELQPDGSTKTVEYGDLLWPERVGDAENEERRLRMGRHRAAGQLQQRPAAREGEILMRADWRYYAPELYNVAIEDVRSLPNMWMVLQSWDTAFKELTTSDYVAGGIWGFAFDEEGNPGADKFLLRLFHARAGLNRVIEEIKVGRDWAIERWPYAKHYQVVELAANGPDVIRKMKRSTPGMMTYNPRIDKTLRAMAAAPDLESHNVFVPGQAKGDWSDYDPAGTPEDTQKLIEECSAFPNAAHDDLVDHFSQAINWARTKAPGVAEAESPADHRIPVPVHFPR